MNHFYLTSVLLFTTVFISISQTHTAKVLANVQHGPNQSITFLQPENTECIVKSNLHSYTVQVGDIVTIEDVPVSETQVKMILSSGDFFYGIESCKTAKSVASSERLTGAEQDFVQRLSDRLDEVIFTNVEADRLFSAYSPYNTFSLMHTAAVKEAFGQISTTNTYEIMGEYRAAYLQAINNRGMSIFVKPVMVGVDSLFTAYLDNYSSESRIVDLRTGFYSLYNSSNFEVVIGELLSSKLSMVNSNENGYALYNAAQDMLLGPDSYVIDPESNQTLLSNEARDLIALGFAAGGATYDNDLVILAAPWWEHPCAGFGISIIGAFSGGPFGVILGVAGVINTAGACEKALGW